MPHRNRLGAVYPRILGPSDRGTRPVPNRQFAPAELLQASALLTDICARPEVFSPGDKDLLFAHRRKVFKELNYDERDKPAVRRKLGDQKWKEQRGLCALSGKDLPERHRSRWPVHVMTDLNRIELAQRYFINDLPGANIPATRLRNVLDTLQRGNPLSALALNYLQAQGLLALRQLALGEITYEAFCATAVTEQFKRRQAAEVERIAEDAAQVAKETECVAAAAVRAAEYERERHRTEESRRAWERDPKYIAKMTSQKLRLRYGLNQFIEEHAFARVMDILHRLYGGSRLNDTDVLWLTTEGKDYYTESLQSAFHEREAEFYAAEYRRTSDPWNAVNASGHYRKYGQPRMAHELLILVPAQQQTTPKLKSAICTTHGGVMRDLDRMDEALALGGQAHELTPRDFRPCTLLGAVNIELGNLSIGWEWYRKAEQRGASERSIDFDLRGIYLRADEARRLEIRTFLLCEDPARYRWVNDFEIGPLRSRPT